MRSRGEEGERQGSDTAQVRLFVACDLPASLVRRLNDFNRVGLSKMADQHGLKVRWVKPHSLHLTLRFLGEADEITASAIMGELQRRVRDLQPFNVTVSGVGVFPSPRRPVVLWAGVDDKESGKLGALASAAEDAVVELGFAPEERPFHAHITLGRVVSAPRTQPVDDILEAAEKERFGDFEIDRIVLYKSVLTPKGPEYSAMGYAILGRGGVDEC